jgi:uncharacterized protein YbjT (DUF2867 family)
MKNHIVVTGATGNTGQVVAEELKRRGVPFVAMARSEKNRKKLEERGIPAVHGDFDDPPTLLSALEGAEKAYLVCTPDHMLGPRETAFVRAADQAGVQHLVKCSAYWADMEGPTANLRSHGRIERAIRDSGMDYTIVRPHGFMQTFTLFSWDMIQKADVLTFPAGEGAMPLVDVRDVAAVAVKALTEKGHSRKEYDVTGPEALTFGQLAEILSRVLGRNITYVPGSEGPFLAGMVLMGVTATPREHTVKIARLVRERRLEKVHTTLQDLGIQPTTYEQFLRDLLAGRTGGGSSFEPPDSLGFKLVSAMMPVMMRLVMRLRGLGGRR